jgi:hypothetical protein
MIGVALAQGMETALRLDLYTNAGTGIALLCAAAILRRHTHDVGDQPARLP